MHVIKTEGSFPIKAWVGFRPMPPGLGEEWRTPDIEDSALKQLKNIARLPFLASNGVAVMPDVHAGVGSTVGSVVATKGAIVPAMAGVDLGCGMVAVRTTLTANYLPDSLAVLRAQIENDVPTGRGNHSNDRLGDSFRGQHSSVFGSVACALNLSSADISRAMSQIGTLGGGNHFIEICLDENQQVWVMLHSGSRGIGNKIGTHFIDKAKELCARWHIPLPDQDLAYIPEGDPFFTQYIDTVEWAQAYALENRKVMLELVVSAMRRHLPAFELLDEAINCHHNYIARESHGGQNLWVTRKGAIRARQDDLGIIPGSMGQRSYIVRGKGNPESYCSCSHGAGRAMSRTEARKRFSLTDLVAQTQGVECRKDDAVLDELPSGYKNIDEVMAQQTDLVDVVAVLKQVLCVKGA